MSRFWPNPGETDGSELGRVGTYLTSGLQFAAVVILFVFAGHWVDQRLHTLPLFTLLGLILGGTGGFFYLYRTLTAEEDEDKEDRAG